MQIEDVDIKKIEAVVTRTVEWLMFAGFFNRELYDELLELEVDVLDLNLQVVEHLQNPVTVH